MAGLRLPGPGQPHLVASRLGELWQARGANRPAAAGAAGSTPLAVETVVPADPELLHAAAQPREAIQLAAFLDFLMPGVPRVLVAGRMQQSLPASYFRDERLGIGS
jgi:hypothetical protein